MRTKTAAVIIGTTGNSHVWAVLAQQALDSVDSQTVRPEAVIRTHEKTLAQARNYGAEKAQQLGAEYLIFLDADDELDSLYVEKMLEGSGDVRQPSTLGVVDGKEDDHPVMIPQKPLHSGNYIVIGAMVTTEMFFDVGGFEELPAYEDWILWVKCSKAGATFGKVPEAIYRVHVHEDGRNHYAGRERLLWDLRAKYYPELYTTPQ